MYEPLRVATQPLTFLLILLAATAVLSLRRTARPLWRRLTVVLTLLLIAAAHPWSAWVTSRALESQYPPVAADGPLPQVRTLVVLSGGLLAGSRGQGVLSEDSLERTVCGAAFARRLGEARIVVTGGRIHPSAPVSVAARMRDLMVDMGVPADRILVEGRAQTTVGNAYESRALLGAQANEPIGLVTEALHMPRAVGIFRAAGFTVVPLPCEGNASPVFHFTSSTMLPGPRAAWLFNLAAHEWIGLVYYRLTGAWK